jgi:hypothetical protein
MKQIARAYYAASLAADSLTATSLRTATLCWSKYKFGYILVTARLQALFGPSAKLVPCSISCWLCNLDVNALPKVHRRRDVRKAFLSPACANHYDCAVVEDPPQDGLANTDALNFS